ncbi:MAG: HEAT repeat domain-containing protein [Planctomycetota bacterium]
MKRRIASMFRAVRAVLVPVTTLVVCLTVNGCRDKPVDNSQQKAGVFLGQLDPKIVEAVEEIKEKNRIPIDGSTQDRIENVTNDIGQEFEYVDVDDRKVPLSTKASWGLREIGKAAIPQLIDAVARHQDPSVRQHALGTVYMIVMEEDENLIEYLPLFVRSMSDKEAGVRIVAAGQIGNMAIHFRSQNDEEKIQQCMPYLIQALKDQDERVRACAGHRLFRLGRIDLVPQELIDKHEIGKWR